MFLNVVNSMKASSYNLTFLFRTQRRFTSISRATKQDDLGVMEEDLMKKEDAKVIPDLMKIRMVS